MLLCCRACFECAEVSAFSGLGIFLPRVKPVFTGFQFSNHQGVPLEEGTPTIAFGFERSLELDFDRFLLTAG